MSNLQKDKQNSILFGVCAGLSDYTGVDVTVLRFATLLGAIFTGSIIFWIYVVLAILLPNKRQD